MSDVTIKYMYVVGQVLHARQIFHHFTNVGIYLTGYKTCTEVKLL